MFNLILSIYLLFFTDFTLKVLMIIAAVIYAVLVYYLGSIYYADRSLFWYLFAFPP
ncbi:hypothetical protein [Enterococcus sp. AZ163]|uniref:hypothetical protein n=1 Tax=Enterococcus sp. AZ163 TaxID=2774638 RepID=UPI003D26FDB1